MVPLTQEDINEGIVELFNTYNLSDEHKIFILDLACIINGLRPVPED
jgi:hypothetical protein